MSEERANEWIAAVQFTVEQAKERKRLEAEGKKPNPNPSYDPRFPNCNQTRRCMQNYVDYYRCVARKGEDYAPCRVFYYNYKTYCPATWIENFDDMREDNAFPYKLE